MEIKFDTPTLTHATKMREPFRYLEENFKIDFFHFARRINNLTPFSISTNKEWHIKYKEEYESSDTFMDIQKIHKYKNIYLWGMDEFKTKKEKQMHEERSKSFSIPPGISLINETDSYIDTFSFSSSMIFNDRVNTLLNASEELYSFGIKFAKDLSPIISDFYKKNTLQINQEKIQPINSFSPFNIKHREFYTYNNKADDINIFSLRQMECVFCSAQGLNSQQTGSILKISKRTVESILNECMIKIGSVNKYQLIYLSTKYGLIKDDLISPEIKKSIENIMLELL